MVKRQDQKIVMTVLTVPKHFLLDNLATIQEIHAEVNMDRTNHFFVVPQHKMSLETLLHTHVAHQLWDRVVQKTLHTELY